MYDEAALKIAKEILMLDYKRDELFEELMSIAGSEGSEILRKVQNGFIPCKNEG